MVEAQERDNDAALVAQARAGSKAAFEAWTRSEAFRAAHSGAGGVKGIYLGHPVFEGFAMLADTKIVPAEAAA